MGMSMLDVMQVPISDAQWLLAARVDGAAGDGSDGPREATQKDIDGFI